MIVSVTADHIAAATPHPNTSPVALALREMGYTDATVGRYYAAFNGAVYVLPKVAVEAEIQFDFVAKGGALQGESIPQIKPYEFEL